MEADGDGGGARAAAHAPLRLAGEPVRAFVLSKEPYIEIERARSIIQKVCPDNSKLGLNWTRTWQTLQRLDKHGEPVAAKTKGGFVHVGAMVSMLDFQPGQASWRVDCPVLHDLFALWKHHHHHDERDGIGPDFVSPSACTHWLCFFREAERTLGFSRRGLTSGWAKTTYVFGE